MKSFEYGDKEIGTVEVFAAVANMTIGFGVLIVPRTTVSVTKSADGWISILIGGIGAVICTWMIAKLVSRFAKQNLYGITSAILNKTTAKVITLLFALYTMFYTGYETRSVASISKLYLFDRTPVEVICLVFLLVLVYAVAGSSASLLRLNIIFLPLVIGVLLVLLVMNVSFFHWDNIRPFFISKGWDVVRASKETIFSFLGFEILLFYNAFINQPKKIVGASILGISVPITLYLIVFFFVIGVFGVEVTANTLFPTAELAKVVQVPGGFFERFESIFFAVWVITLFNTAAMAFDVTLLAIESIFSNVKRMTLILIVAPIIYLLALQPKNMIETANLGNFISYIGLGIAIFFPLILLIIAMIRGVKGTET